MYGVYIHNATVRKAKPEMNIQKKCALGRPWVSFDHFLVTENNLMEKQNEFHRSIFARCYLDDSIKDGGYIDWSGRTKAKTMMAEYQNRLVILKHELIACKYQLLIVI
jgi:hypothetical protein